MRLSRRYELDADFAGTQESKSHISVLSAVNMRSKYFVTFVFFVDGLLLFKSSSADRYPRP